MRSSRRVARFLLFTVHTAWRGGNPSSGSALSFQPDQQPNVGAAFRVRGAGQRTGFASLR
jgi:hypothetical protein